jgi:hypothetical protein
MRSSREERGPDEQKKNDGKMIADGVANAKAQPRRGR